MRTALFLLAGLVASGLGVAPGRAAGGFIETFFGPSSQTQQMAYAPVYPAYLAPPPAIRPPLFRMRKVAIAPPAHKASVSRTAQHQRLTKQRREMMARIHVMEAKIAAKARDPRKTLLARQLSKTPGQTAPAQGAVTKGVLAYAPPLITPAAVKSPAVVKPETAQEAISRVMHDDTLRPGDAYMAADGLRIFVGDRKRTKVHDGFISFEKARDLDRTLRARLAAVERPKPRRVASRRSVEKIFISATPHDNVSPRAEPERRAVGPDGKSIRFVGAYF